MSTVNMHDAKSRLSSLVEALESGRETEVVIARNGHPVARIPDHADPFDRVMVAQALHEGMPLVSADPKPWRYHATLVLPA
ncbi:type II toxin-antitoxin system Phd/YefM family antitoxin [Burkholderia multivorans]|uniref:type II toxin-antitoxin system Phd/YefM family antitoxin n=1 Tax=Burkholderia multivorans TaxID=87883 RepID=UPI000D007F44|nr:type II toxin-antitoxin system Phd/YefM family antitoxin [Burkholderia multivorans]MBU9629582.1 type II toxin-antitoxin system Phd/YefM family antitoxin [Burkholderia multivorans]PRG21491.1 hypothetical protein C6Q35_20005 [Burkholderia multivorans]